MGRIRIVIVAGCLVPAVALVPATVGSAAPSLEPRSVAATSTLAVIKTIAVLEDPQGVAINNVDDTVYVTNKDSKHVSVINGVTGTVDDTISLVDYGFPSSVAVNDLDDTVYITTQGPPDDIGYADVTVVVINGRVGTVDDTISGGFSAYQPSVAVNQVDDTVYVTHFYDNTNLVIDGRTNAWNDGTTFTGFFQGVAVNQVDDTVYLIEYELGTMRVMNGRNINDTTTITVAAEYDPWAVAINQADDTVYVANELGTVSVINGRTNTWDETITVAEQYDLRGVAVDQVDDTVYVANDSGTVSVINGRTNTWEDTITVGAGPRGVAVDDSGTNAGLVYVTNSGADSMSVIGRVSPSLGSAAGRAGSTVTVNLDVPQVAYDVDDATITSVSFGGRLATGLTARTGDAWNLKVPAGTGTVPVTVTFNGGLTASAGSFTYSSPKPSITITGTRDGQRITVTGTATGLAGKKLRPWIRFPGQSAHSQGTAVITPAADGTFTWSRKTDKRTSVYIAHGETKSNTVIIPAR